MQQQQSNGKRDREYNFHRGVFHFLNKLRMRNVFNEVYDSALIHFLFFMRCTQAWENGWKKLCSATQIEDRLESEAFKSI